MKIVCQALMSFSLLFLSHSSQVQAQYPDPPEGVDFSISHVEEPSASNQWTWRLIASITEDMVGLIYWPGYEANALSVTPQGFTYNSGPGVSNGNDTLNMSWNMNIVPNQQYFVTAYFVQYQGANVVWVAQDTMTVYVSDIATQIDLIERESFEVYPNPSNGLFVLELGDLSGKTRVEIYDGVGAMVYAKTISEPKTLIDVSKLAKGSYFIHLIHNETKIGLTQMILVH